LEPWVNQKRNNISGPEQKRIKNKEKGQISKVNGTRFDYSVPIKKKKRRDLRGNDNRT